MGLGIIASHAFGVQVRSEEGCKGEGGACVDGVCYGLVGVSMSSWCDDI